MLEEDEALALDYDYAASFVGFLRDRFGMPALLELYAALDGVDAEGPRTSSSPSSARTGPPSRAHTCLRTPRVALSARSTASFRCSRGQPTPGPFAVASHCEDAATTGPYLGWSDEDTPASERHVILEISAPGTYAVTMTSSAKTSINVEDWHDKQLGEEIELSPGRKRLTIVSDIADEAVGEVVLSGPL